MPLLAAIKITPHQISESLGETLDLEGHTQLLDDATLQCDVKLGKIANWIAPPRRGINGQPFEYEYVKLA